MDTVVSDPGVIKKYVLVNPVEYAGTKIYQLEFRALKAKDHVSVEKLREAGPIEKAAAYLQLLTKQDPYVIDNLSHEDLMAASEILTSFLIPSQKNSTKT